MWLEKQQGIRLIFMQADESLKICTLIRSFCRKHMKFRWTNTEELCFLALNSDAKLKEKLFLGSKNDMRNLVNFHPTTQKYKNFTSMGYFCPNYIRFEQKKYSFHGKCHWKLWHKDVTFYRQKLYEKVIH